MHGAFVIVLFVLHASAQEWNSPGASFTGSLAALTYQRSGGQCLLCHAENQCLAFNQNRCEYYLETSKILGTSLEEKPENVVENPKLKAEVDSLVFSIMDRAKSEDLIRECIPYVSKYTDCTKENVCLGCKTCDCDQQGRWNCSITQTCRPEVIIPGADERTLFSVIKTLKQEPKTTRRKRALGHSIRSLEDMHLGEDREDNEREQERRERITKWVSEWTYPVDSDEDMFTQNENGIDIEPHEHIDSNDREKDYKLIKMIVDSILYDTLPNILKQNNLDIENNRVKRDVNAEEHATTTEYFEMTTTSNENATNILSHKISFKELSDWVSHVHPLIYTVQKIDPKSSSEENVSDDNHVFPQKEQPTTSAPSTKGKITGEPVTISNPDYLAFEEVYGNIQVDNRTYTRRKPPLDHSPNYDSDFNMYDDKYYKEQENTSSSIGDNVKNIISIFTSTIDDDIFMEAVTESNQESTTKVVVDLLETANAINFDNETENLDLTNNKIDNLNTDTFEPISAVNIMKRDVSSNIIRNETNATISKNTTLLRPLDLINATKNNVSSTIIIDDLKESILDPLDNILEYKHKEINQMLKIRENLVNFLQAHFRANISNSTKNYSLLHNFEYTSHHHRKSQDLRSTNASVLDRYMMKLKHDVYEVIRDIVGIKKFYNSSTKFPSELIFLVKSLKHYIHKTGFQLNKNKMLTNYRRSNIHYDNNSGNSVKNVIVKIFELLTKNKPSLDALAPISSYSQRILKRLIKKHYVDDFAGTGLRVYDPHYNLTNDLNTIGARWQTLTAKIAASSAADKLDNMKRLHLVLSIDINKMNDALALVEFARGRRMMPVDEATGERIVDNINRNLNIVKDKMNEMIIRGFTVPLEDVKPDEIIIPIHKKKNSFLSQIKKLLRTSKMDILKLLRRKVPKAEIVKEIARKNVEEMTKRKLRDTMEKWQTNLNIISTRDKRSVKDYNTRRIKNIIPKYLRGKVSRMTKKSKDKSKKGKTGASGRKKKGLRNSTAKHTTTKSLGHTTTAPEPKTTLRPTSKGQSEPTSSKPTPPPQLNTTKKL